MSQLHFFSVSNGKQSVNKTAHKVELKKKKRVNTKRADVNETHQFIMKAV